MSKDISEYINTLIEAEPKADLIKVHTYVQKFCNPVMPIIVCMYVL